MNKMPSNLKNRKKNKVPYCLNDLICFLVNPRYGNFLVYRIFFKYIKLEMGYRDMKNY